MYLFLRLSQVIFFFLYFSLVSMNSSVVMRRFVPPGTKSRIVCERSSRVREIQVNHSNFKKCYVDCIQGNHRSPEELRFQTSFTIDEICWNVLGFPFFIVDHLKFIFAYITFWCGHITEITFDLEIFFFQCKHLKLCWHLNKLSSKHYLPLFVYIQ